MAAARLTGANSAPFCELSMRIKAVRLNNGQSYATPITQAELADATGLSRVHVNRTMQEFRANRGPAKPVRLAAVEFGRQPTAQWVAAPRQPMPCRRDW